MEHSVSMTFYCVTVKVTVKMDQMKMGIFAEVRHFIIPNERKHIGFDQNFDSL